MVNKDIHQYIREYVGRRPDAQCVSSTRLLSVENIGFNT